MANEHDSADIPRCITVIEAAKALGIGRNSAYAAAARGEIPTIRIGGRLVVPLEAFRERLRQ
ncbi:MAG: helix-turn-helix domain-containing protein [Proteobacteria bacterium]|nr:helix-turn-helix domain-containing protein [Pseudomonadota bacterium]